MISKYTANILLNQIVILMAEIAIETAIPQIVMDPDIPLEEMELATTGPMIVSQMIMVSLLLVNLFCNP